MAATTETVPEPTQSTDLPAAQPANTVTQADIEAIKQAAKAEALAQFKEATGFDSLDAYKTNKLKAEGKLQELADKHAADAQTYKTLFQQSAINNAIFAASTESKDPAVINAMLARDCICDNDGNVSIGGKTVAEAVKALLIDKPFLAKAQGTAGSGMPPNAPASSKKTEGETLNPQQRLIAARAGN